MIQKLVFAGIALLLALALSHTVLAQGAGGTITGTVIDPSGGAVPIDVRGSQH